jgi:predicted ABC-type ATPase
MPECYIIAGPNGSGKSTFACEFLPNFVNCLNFINPDLIARGLSPFDPGRAMIRAGRLVIEQFKSNLARRTDFGFETTLAGRTYLPLIMALASEGYQVHMFYLWIPNADLALERIRGRVRSGGHDVPDVDVRRRYGRSLRNLFQVYRPHLHTLHIFDNSTTVPELVYYQEHGNSTVLNHAIYNQLTAAAGV